MTIRTTLVTVGTTPTALAPGSDADSSYRNVLMQNDSAVIVYVGGPDVTTTHGLKVQPDQTFSLDDAIFTDKPYAIVATGTANVRVFEAGI